LIGDAATAHTNGLFNALAVNALNVLLGGVGKPGGLLFSPMWEMPSALKSSAPAAQMKALVNKALSETDPVKVLLLYNANPVFGSEPGSRVREALAKIPFIASFGSFIDETSAFADLVLPDSSPLESWLDDAPPSGSSRTVVSVAAPAMHPLHDTRSMPNVLLDVAQQLGGDLAKALPWKTYDESIKAAFTALHKEKGAQAEKDPMRSGRRRRTRRMVER